MFWEQNVQVAVESHIGLRRKNNEDASCYQLCQNEQQWAHRGHLFVVADGMGGHAVGELASRIAVETLPHTFFKATESDVRNTLRDAVVAANRAIYERGSTNEDFLHMGTTCTSLTLCRRGAIIAHVGDSRAYRIRRDRIDQLTFDHSLEWEIERNHRSLAGVVDSRQHRNIITRSLGPEAEVDVDVEGPYPVLPGDLFILCSDGLSNQVGDEEIGAIARELPPAQAAKLLVNLANIRGGPDNSTVIVTAVGELPANVEPDYVEEEPEAGFQLEWSWLIGFALTAILLVFGLAMMVLGQPIQGGITSGVSVTIFIVLMFIVLRRQRQFRVEYSDESRTQLIRPHMTAVCLDSKALYERLSAIEDELQRAAHEDGWGVKWKEHDAAIQIATESAQSKRYSKGVRALARAIGLIMDEHPVPNPK